MQSHTHSVPSPSAASQIIVCLHSSLFFLCTSSYLHLLFTLPFSFLHCSPTIYILLFIFIYVYDYLQFRFLMVCFYNLFCLPSGQFIFFITIIIFENTIYDATSDRRLRMNMLVVEICIEK